jgi:hypothetical protein
MNKENGVVKVNFTIGFGNNLFQYCYARLLAETHGLSFSHTGISELGVQAQHIKSMPFLPTVVVDDKNYKKMLYSKIANCNIIVNGYFEDYKIFKPHLHKIRNWFTKAPITNKKDVILHLRLQNRLVQESHHKNHISASSIKHVLNDLEYRNLHIVTDAEKWSEYDEDDIEKIQQQIKVGPNPTPAWVSTAQSLEYINHLIAEMDEFKPIVHCNGANMLPGSGGLRGDFMDDFNLIRSFDKVIVHNSTFSWWAAVLSGASEVAVFNPWKIAKPVKDRRNLGETDYNGWFSWGGKDALYFKHYALGR